jgi:molybdenum cofactor synthesis domain-containing protein
VTVASVVVIGNEILTGKFADENGPFFVRRLRELGVDLRRLCVVADTLDDIADEVARCAAVSDVVFTTGGVGPTHDDLTFEGVARAFGVPLVVHPELRATLEAFGVPLTAAHLRMATVPEGSELVTGERVRVPIVRCRNVFVLPGVPALAHRGFEVIAPMLGGTPVRCLRIYARNAEGEVADAMTSTAEAWPAVAIGSYPRFDAEDHTLIVTLESRDPAALAAARAQLEPALRVVRVVEDPPGARG